MGLKKRLKQPKGKMTIKRLGIINPQNQKAIIRHLSENDERFTYDLSSYAKNRKSYWLQSRWNLKDRIFEPGIRDKKIWDYCKTWMPDADIGLVVHGDVGITEHRDDSYADYRAVGINLGELEFWTYNCMYPEMRWTKEQNPSNKTNHKIGIGDVFEFNCKNPHSVVNPAEDRYAIFLWKIKKNFRSQFQASMKLNLEA